MQANKWSKYRKVILVSLLCVSLYLFLKPSKYSYAESGFIPDIHPEKVWEFVADFSNMKYLNPTIKSFNVISESGNYEHWKYSVKYIENLSHWPYLQNTGVGSFDVKAISTLEVFYVRSIHNTCFFHGLLCLQSNNEFKFSRGSAGDGAVCEDFVEYWCPPAWSGFCQREVAYQRDKIMTNLKKHFELTQL